MKPTRDDLVTLFFSALWTFIEAFTGALVVDSLLSLDVEVWQFAALSGGAGVASVIKSFAAKFKTGDVRGLR